MLPARILLKRVLVFCQVKISRNCSSVFAAGYERILKKKAVFMSNRVAWLNQSFNDAVLYRIFVVRIMKRFDGEVFANWRRRFGGKSSKLCWQSVRIVVAKCLVVSVAKDFRVLYLPCLFWKLTFVQTRAQSGKGDPTRYQGRKRRRSSAEKCASSSSKRQQR